MVARLPTVVGIISSADMNIIYKSFPKWKQKLQSLNMFTFKRCEAILERFDDEIKALMIKKSLNLNFEAKTKQEIR